MNLNFINEALAKLGLMGIPLVLTSVVAVAICIERMVFFWRHRLRSRTVYQSLREPRGSTGRPTNSPLWHLLTAYREHGSLPEEKRRRCCEAVVLGWSHRARAPVRQLSVLAQVAPLLGLTGTVLGLVEAFQVLEKSEKTASPSLLAGGIWEALLTTVAGMLIAIPLIIIVRIFNSRIDRTLVAARQLFSQLEKEEAAAAAETKHECLSR